MLRRAIADTCFLIDWSYYSRRDLLFRLFDVVYVTESVLDEVGYDPTITWVSERLADGRMALLTESPQASSEAYRLMALSRLEPRMRDLDYPEAVCLALARALGAAVLTENRAAVLAPRLIEECRGVTVWRSLEVIRELILRGHIACEPTRDAVARVFREYMEETRHLFSSSELSRVVESVVACLRRSGRQRRGS